MTDNAAQADIWNGAQGARWASRPERADYRLANIHAALMRLAAPKAGEDVLDIGCGCGTATAELAANVAPGRAVGLDISEPMLAVARAHVAANLSFLKADAASHPFRERYDLIFSRFGVMFFADPVLAFTHIRAALKPGGRLVFAAWRAREDNPWILEPLRAALGDAPLPPSIPNAPGQFGFADGARLASILTKAGFDPVDVCRFDTLVRLGATAEEAVEEALNTGDVSRQCADMTDAERAPIRARLLGLMQSHVGPGGVALPGCAWLVRAK